MVGMSITNPKTPIAVVIALLLAVLGYEWFSYSRASRYVSAAYLSEGLSVASMFKQHIAMHFQMNGELPHSNTELDLPAPGEFKGEALTRAEVSHGGVITLTYNEQSGVAGGRIHLVPDLGNPAMGIRWRCLTSSYSNITVTIPQCRYQSDLQLPNTQLAGLPTKQQSGTASTAGQASNSFAPTASNELSIEIDKLSSANAKAREKAKKALNAQYSAAIAFPLLVDALDSGSREKIRAVTAFLAEDISFGIRTLAEDDLSLITLLASMLKDSPREQRITSLRAIRNLAAPVHNELIMPVLLEILGDRTEISEMRATAVEVLARLRTPAANKELVQFASDYDSQVSKNAIYGLGTFPGSRSSVNALRDVLFDRNSSVRLEAVEALDRLGLQTDGVLEVFTSALDDPDVDVMLRAVRALADKNAAAAVPNLISALDTSEVPDVVAYALGEIGAPAAQAIPKMVRTLIDPTTKGRPASIARAIDTILAQAPNSIDREAIASLAEALPVIHGHALDYVISAMLRAGGTFPEAVAGLANWAALETADEYRRVEVLEKVGTFGLTAIDAVPALAKASNSKYPNVRQAAIRALAEIGPATPGVVRETIVLIVNRSQRQEAERALASMLARNERQTIKALAHLVRDKRDDVREESVQQLAKHGKTFPEATAALNIAIEDPRTRIARRAAETLAQWQSQ